MLCTPDKTFGMRSVVLSNTLLVVTPVPDEHASGFADDAVVIRDQLNEVIELVPAVPKLHKLSTLIRNRQYDEGQEDEPEDDDSDTVRKSSYCPARVLMLSMLLA